MASSKIKKEATAFIEHGFQNVTGITPGNYVHSRGSNRAGWDYGTQNNGVGRTLWARRSQSDQTAVSISLGRYDVPDAPGDIRSLNFRVSDPRWDLLLVRGAFTYHGETARRLAEGFARSRVFLADIRTKVHVGVTGDDIVDDLRKQEKYDGVRYRHRGETVTVVCSTLLDHFSGMYVTMPADLFAGTQRAIARRITEVAEQTLDKILKAKPT